MTNDTLTVLKYLANDLPVNKYTHYEFASLLESTGLDKKTVNAALKELTESGHINYSGPVLNAHGGGGIILMPKGKDVANGNA